MGDHMFKKGLAALVALTVMAAAWSWAATTFQLQTKLGNAGGTIQVREKALQTVAGSVVYNNFTTSAAIPVTVSAKPGYKISSVKKGTVAQTITDDQVYTTDIVKTSALTQSLIATFAAQQMTVTGSVVGAGTITPATAAVAYNGSVVLSASPANGFAVLTGVTGGATAIKDLDGNVVTLPFSKPVKITVANVTSNKAITATYTAVSVNAGADKEVVSAASVTLNGSVSGGGAATWSVVSAPEAVTLSSLTAANPSFTPTVLGGTYIFRLTESLGGNSDTVQITTVGSLSGSCEGCHNAAGSVPGKAVAEWKTGAHGTASGKTTGTCQRCHATEGSIAGATAGWTGSYTAVLKPYTSNVWRNNKPAASTNGISCVACHNPHGLLREINTIVAGNVVGWDPNQNGKNNDQFDVCTGCHTIQDNAGAQTDMYHEASSISVTRMIADSHYDNPATVGHTTGTAPNTIAGLVEGYVIRTQSANPCADCHNLHSADLTVQEAWAKSAHSGKIATKKDTAARAQSIVWFNATYPTNAAVPVDSADDTATVGTSTRSVLEFFQRDAAGVAFYKTVGATDDAEGNAWTHYNWDQTTSRGACQRCHTATGIANFLTNPAAYDATGNGNDFSHLSGWTKAAGSPQNELIYCWGCHSDSQTGTLRNPGAITENYAAATAGAPVATVVYPDLGKSNVCMGCHLGREIGQTVANDTDADGTRGFVNSHYLAAGAIVFGEAGYEFAGKTYTKTFQGHAAAGASDGKGPCVTCHMTSTEAHAFEVVTKDATGAVTGIATTSCNSCHGDMNAAWLEERKEAYHAALENLNIALQSKGIYFQARNPYFFVGPGATDPSYTTWAAPYGFDAWKNVMGAAFNYNLLEHDPGSYAHNRSYALQLIADSIDFIADGVVDNAGVVTIDVAGVPTATDLLAPVKAAVGATLDAKHFNGSADQAQFVAQQISCADCHAPNTSANAVIVDQYAESAHGDVKGAAWVSEEMFNNSCAKCHSTGGFITGGAPAVAFTAGGSQQVLACSGCHTNVENGEIRAKGQITVAYKSRTIDTATGAFNPAAAAGFPNVGEGNNLCIACHSGRESGETVLALADTAMGNTSFKNPHYLGAAGMMYAKLAFISFTSLDTVVGTTTYGKSVIANEDGGGLTSTHRKLGTPAMAGNTNGNAGLLVSGGPCVTCHMSTVKDHTWEINANSFNQVCVNCHTEEAGTTLTAENFMELFIDEQAVPFNDAVAVAEKELLDNYNIQYTDAYPYFIDNSLATPGPAKDWTRGGALSAAEAKKLMGAALNIKLMKADPAAYAHARSYSRRVLYDTIDWLDNKIIDMSAGNTALADFPAKYVKDATAGGTTTESFKFLAGYNRTSLVWNALERP